MRTTSENVRNDVRACKPRLSTARAQESPKDHLETPRSREIFLHIRVKRNAFRGNRLMSPVNRFYSPLERGTGDDLKVGIWKLDAKLI